MNDRIPYTEDSVTVTPDVARQWLARNVHNRALSQDRIRIYARDMAAGRWIYTGEPVAFDINGDLANGQNRLHACIAADVPFTTAVAYNLPLDAVRQFDTGKPRSAADVLKMERDSQSANNLAATIKVLAGWETGKIEHCMSISGGGRLDMSHSEIVAFADEHPDLDDHLTTGRWIAKQLKLPPSGCSASVYRLHHIDPEACADFAKRIIDGYTSGPGDPIVALETKCRQMDDQKMIRRASLAIYVLVRTWNAYRLRKPLRTIPLSNRGEWHKIPDPL